MESLRRSVWSSSLITLVGLALFVGVTALVPQPANDAGLTALGIFLALVPAVVWLAFFYQQDRSEPEPKRLVVRMFIFGAVGAFVVPFVADFQTSLWSTINSPLLRFTSALVTIALLQETIKVAMVRYVVLGTNEFDRTVDGIVYGLASGLGFATVMTIWAVLQSDGVLPLAGGIQAVNNALIHGALGAVSGYYLGRVKIDGKSLLWMASGLGLVTLVNAIYLLISEEVSRSLSFNPWYSLIVSVVLALVVGGVLFGFFRRAMLRDSGALSTVSEQAHARSRVMPWDIHIRYDYLFIGALVVSIIASLGVMTSFEGRAQRYTGESVGATFDFPSGWAVERGETGQWSVTDLTGEGTVKPVFAIKDQKLRDARSIEIVTLNYVTALQDERTYYVELEQEESLDIAGQPATRVMYQYARNTPSGPVIVTAADTYIINGERLLTFRYEAEAAVFDEHYNDYLALLDSVELNGE